MTSEVKLTAALRDLLKAIDRCEDNDFSQESRKNLTAAADSAATVLTPVPPAPTLAR
ncbi:MAG: hypothetical protein FD165_2778 [Gammaproteobacteria bacterium]|nr:MAG: hypothetical protein FD165_2778 [Gammaproteobacteria bacterium]